MSETVPPVEIPEWDQADGMRKALRVSGTSVNQMADYLGVRRETVSTWLTGRHQPDKRTLMLWAMRCGVPFEWLTGLGWAPRGSNPQPTDYEYEGSPMRHLLAVPLVTAA
jgi:transcriptional regulator with XRE-family HTH domain